MNEVADPSGAFQTKDFVTIAISVLSLGVTIFWNLANRRHTDDVAKEIRSEAYDLDRWKSLRSEIMRTLRDFEGVARRMALLAHGTDDLKSLQDKILEENRSLVDKHLALQQELERGAFQPSWVGYSYGSYVDGESDWDRLISLIQDIVGLDNPEQMRFRLSGLIPPANGIAAAVNEAVSERDQQLHPGQSGY